MPAYKNEFRVDSVLSIHLQFPLLRIMASGSEVPLEMSASSPRKDWDARLEQIPSSAQWMQAIAWRGIVRGLPLLPDLLPVLPLAQAALRLLYATIFRLDRDYRRRFGSPAAEATIRAALAADSLVEQVRQLYHSSKQHFEDLRIAELVHWTFMALESSTTEAPALAHEALRKLREALAQFFPTVLEAWENELIADLEELEFLDREKLDDLQSFLVRRLWAPSDPAEAGRKRLAAMLPTGPEVSAAFLGLLKHCQQHLSNALDWAGVRSLILEGERRRLSPDAAVALQDIANDPVRLATLLAKAALDDRARLKLTTDPSAPTFRNGFPDFAFDPTALVELDRRLEKSYPHFTPHPLWLAWIQTARRAGLEAIQAEIRLRLSESDAATPGPEPSSTEVAPPPRPVRNQDANPASNAVRMPK